jgi:hypothetical protein
LIVFHRGGVRRASLLSTRCRERLTGSSESVLSFSASLASRGYREPFGRRVSFT